MSMERFDADFDRIFSEPDHKPDCPAQLAVEGGAHQRAAVPRPALDRPASEWTQATRIAAADELAHIFGGPNGK